MNLLKFFIMFSVNLDVLVIKIKIILEWNGMEKCFLSFFDFLNVELVYSFFSQMYFFFYQTLVPGFNIV